MNESLQKMQEAVITAISFLMALDPEADSPEGELLIGLGKAQAQYEKRKGYFQEDGIQEGLIKPLERFRKAWKE